MSERRYDVVVIGAGPAGSMAALRAARAGASVLLVERHRFPRDKACGCCLNGAALAALGEAGLAGLPAALGARPLRDLELAAGKARARIAIERGASVSRAALDAALASAACESGVEIVEGVAGECGPVEGDGRRVRIGARSVLAGCVVCATGLGAGEAEPGRMGLWALLPCATEGFPTGRVHMACDEHGYVGLVRLEDGRLDVASAMCPRYVRDCGGPGPAVRLTLDRVGWAAPRELGDARWRGTPLLTRTRGMVSGERLLIAGDACGYVEPFTGEGIAWALAGGWAVGALAAERWRPEIAQRWSRAVGRLRHGP